MNCALRAYLKLSFKQNLKIKDNITLDAYCGLVENSENIEEEICYLRQIKTFFENLLQFEILEEEKELLKNEV